MDKYILPMRKIILATGAVFAFILLSGSDKELFQADITMQTQNKNTETVTLGGGCFWCTEAVFSRLKGVTSVTPGYSGGVVKNPTYKEVCSGLTGHAEVIQVVFDPAVISFRDLLEVFFSTHDPTTLNRQGADTGTQYRSVIFYHTEEQEETARNVIDALNREKVWSTPVVTEVSPFTSFYPAEDYHKAYYANNPNAGYCRMVIKPKVEKLEKVFGDKLR